MTICTHLERLADGTCPRCSFSARRATRGRIPSRAWSPNATPSAPSLPPDDTRAQAVAREVECGAMREALERLLGSDAFRDCQMDASKVYQRVDDIARAALAGSAGKRAAEVIAAARAERCEWCKKGVIMALDGCHYLEQPDIGKTHRFVCTTPKTCAALAALDGEDKR